MGPENTVRPRQSQAGALADGVDLNGHEDEDQQGRQNNPAFPVRPQEQLSGRFHDGLGFELRYWTTQWPEGPSWFSLSSNSDTRHDQNFTMTQSFQ